MTVTSPGSSWSFAVGLRDGATFDSPLPTVDVFAGGAAIALPVVITASGGSYSVEVDTATLPEDTLVFARVSGFIDGRYMEFASTTLMASVGTNLTELTASPNNKPCWTCCHGDTCRHRPVRN